MKHFGLTAAAALLAAITLCAPASARIGIAPSGAVAASQDDAVIQVRGGHGHHGWRGHRGHHYGWYRGRGHWRHHHHR